MATTLIIPMLFLVMQTNGNDPPNVTSIPQAYDLPAPTETFDPLLDSTSKLHRPIVCCTAIRPCQTVFWPLTIEKGFHVPLTAKFGRSQSSIFRPRLDNGDECRLITEKSIRGDIRYRLPAIIGNWTVIEQRLESKNGRKNNARIRVYAFESSLEYYRFLIDKLITMSNIDSAFIDYYVSHSDLADLVRRVIEDDTPWFRIEIEYEISHFAISIDHRKSILNDRFVAAFSRKFRFRLYYSEAEVRKSWFELFEEFGTHYSENGRLGGAFAIYGKIDCDQPWAHAFESLDTLRNCLAHVVGKDDSSIDESKSRTPEIELCENVTRSIAIKGHVEIAGGRDRIKEQLMAENSIKISSDLLWREWPRTLRDWPSLIGADLKSICNLIAYILEEESEDELTTDDIDKLIKSCDDALQSYYDESEPFTGQISIDQNGSKTDEESTDHSEKARRFENQCDLRQSRTRLQQPVQTHKQMGTVTLSVRYGNNDSLCVELKTWKDEADKGNIAICPLFRAESAAIAGSATGSLPGLNIAVIVLVATGGTLLAIFGILRTLPAF